MPEHSRCHDIRKAIYGLEHRGENICRWLGWHERSALPAHVEERYRAWVLSDEDDAFEVAALLAALRQWLRDLGGDDDQAADGRESRE